MFFLDLLVGIICLILIPLSVKGIDKLFAKTLTIGSKKKKRVSFTDLPLPHLSIYLGLMICLIAIYHYLVGYLVGIDIVIRSTSNLVGPIIAISSVYLSSSIQQFIKSIY